MRSVARGKADYAAAGGWFQALARNKPSSSLTLRLGNHAWTAMKISQAVGVSGGHRLMPSFQGPVFDGGGVKQIQCHGYRRAMGS